MSPLLMTRETSCLSIYFHIFSNLNHPRGGSRNSLKGGGGSGPEFFEGGGGGLGSRSVGIFIY